MAITVAQKTDAVTILLENFNQPSILAHYLPGATPQSVVAAIVSAIGTNFDTQLTTVENTKVADLNAQLTSTQASVTQIQAEITGATVV